jgi:hypothetical protein
MSARKTGNTGKRRSPHRWDKPLVDPIAAMRLVGLDASGARRDIVMEVGRPYALERDAACPVALWGLDGNYGDAPGTDTLQALCLAVSLALSQLRAYRERGGRLFYASDGTNGGDEAAASPFDPSDPSNSSEEMTDRDLAALFGCFADQERWGGLSVGETSKPKKQARE